MKNLTKFAVIALAAVVMASAPYTPGSRRGHRDQAPQIQLVPGLRPTPNQPGQEHPDQAGLVVSDLNHGITPTDLVNALVGSGVTISNVSFTGNARAAGIFSGGTTILGFDSGIVLGSGSVQTLPEDVPCSAGVEGPNDCYEPLDSNSTD